MYLQASGQLSVDTSHSSIGSTCGNSNCASSNLGLILRTGQHACRQNSHSMLSACTEQTSLASSSCLLCTGHSRCCHDSTYMLYWGKPEHPSIPVRLLNYVVLNCTCPEIHDVSTRTCAGLKGARVDAVIAVAVIVFVLALVTLRSWQLRRRRRLGYLVQNTWEFRLRNQIRRCFGEHTAATFAIGLFCLVTCEDGYASWIHCLLLPLQLAACVQRHLEVYMLCTAHFQ